LPARFFVDENDLALGRALATEHRSPVTAEYIGLSFRRPWRPWRRHVSAPKPVPIGASGQSNILRLEPGDMTEVFLDFWPVVGALPEQLRGHRLVVRGSARRVGRRWWPRSPWWKRWVIEPGQETLSSHAVMTPELRAFQAFWRCLRANDADPYEVVHAPWLAVALVLESGAPDDEAVVAALEPYVQEETDAGALATAVMTAWRTSGEGAG
jgi:hypothetical protein